MEIQKVWIKVAANARDFLGSATKTRQMQRYS
jgi:hypothetical protein